MRRVGLFAEDLAHEAILKSLVGRFSLEYHIAVDIRTYSASGGHGTVIANLRRFLRDLERGEGDLPDVVIVAADCNCKGFQRRKQEIDGASTGFPAAIILAIPEPHIERWLLLDSAAFKVVLGRGCAAPDRKCERDRYKNLLLQAIRDASRTPILGGLEYAELLVNAMDLQYVEQADDSLGRLLKALRDQFGEWLRG